MQIKGNTKPNSTVLVQYIYRSKEQPEGLWYELHQQPTITPTLLPEHLYFYKKKRGISFTTYVFSSIAKEKKKKKSITGF